MDEELISSIRKKLKDTLSKHRFTHTKGVAYTAANLAMRYDYDIEKAFIAGLLHDCAKSMPEEQMVKLCLKNDVEITEFEMQAQYLLHAKAGSIIAKKEFGINDKEILSAIKYHTTGHDNMTMLEKIIFVADYIEPHRKELPNMASIRKACYEDLDLGVYMIARDTLEYLKSQNKAIDETTNLTYKYYKNVTNSNN